MKTAVLALIVVVGFALASAVHAGDARVALGAAALQSARVPGPWPMAAFAPPVNAGAPRQHFEGRLTLTTERAERSFTVILDKYGDAKANHGAATHLPDFDFEFVQDGNALIPVRRGAIPAKHPEWEFILEPGEVWDEAGDGEFSRASLPFTLEERNANCMHQGVLTFLFRSDGAISDVAYEIAQETCAYFQFTWWGYSQAHFAPQEVASRESVVASYREEIKNRLPVRPISTLGADFPGAVPERFGSALEVPAASMTVYGLLANGVHYRSDCLTRQGPYPFCDVMDVPSYSLAKTLIAAMSMMRLATEYPDIWQARIADYVPECAGRDGWGDITFGNALDMSTGRYDSSKMEADEDALDMSEFFFVPERHAQKIRFACKHYPRHAPPGSLWVYHTTDTYVLGTALNAYYRSKAGAGADFYRDLLAQGLWPALRLSPGIGVTRRTYDEVQQPYTGYGLTLHTDDIAKLATFLAAGHGKIGTQQVLEPKLLEEALQRDPAHPGLRADLDVLRYNHGLWAWNTQATLGCHAPTWVPFLSGFGGIEVALLPNGMIYYYVSDGGVFRWALAAAEANRIRNFCQG